MFNHSIYFPSIICGRICKYFCCVLLVSATPVRTAYTLGRNTTAVQPYCRLTLKTISIIETIIKGIIKIIEIISTFVSGKLLICSRWPGWRRDRRRRGRPSQCGRDWASSPSVTQQQRGVVQHGGLATAGCTPPQHCSRPTPRAASTPGTPRTPGTPPTPQCSGRPGPDQPVTGAAGASLVFATFCKIFCNVRCTAAVVTGVARGERGYQRSPPRPPAASACRGSE